MAKELLGDHSPQVLVKTMAYLWDCFLDLQSSKAEILSFPDSTN